jgi:hypothetical protein
MAHTEKQMEIISRQIVYAVQNETSKGKTSNAINVTKDILLYEFE